MAVSSRGTAGIAALLGALAACPYILVPSGPGWTILAYLSQLPLFAAGLWLGSGAAVLSGLAGAVILVVTGGLLTAVVFGVVDALPVALLVRQALLARPAGGGAVEWYPPGLLTAWLTGFGLAALAVTLVLVGGAAALQAGLQEALAPMFDRRLDSLPEHDAVLAAIAFVLPGILGASWMLMTATNGSLAQGVLARFGANWRPSPDLAALGLPLWIPVLLALAAGASLFSGTARFVGISVMIVLAVPFCLAGLAVLHTFARRFSRPAVLLITFYMLAGVLGWPLLLITLLGVAESSLGLRRRFARS
jgi:hypothetical protein